MSSELLTVTGTLLTPERIALPPGGVATVKLVDAAGEVLAGTAVDATDVPVAFTLTVDPTFVTDPDSLFLWAALRSEAGVWGTTEIVPVEGSSPEVVLAKIED
ncbi:hypothetical protein GEV29_04075 [Aeromicrobium sp. SMF47]|uniref:Uncharacterized protein n=1 Tax=Aeromicrobium yanjiei TaxID=2662028 RepID=A0A5Q2MMP7_9ACTN|nr:MULTISPECIES: YbaY family lipoprotein [Aeromicrobium]MRJ75702.1 hypothetical protein [Aeromicrobium yanjiei]MRK00047.1 hypothetical protein [Aeromicrobium sp. S22]QGG43043.1 hypothetical protein GEV26_17580 [Aeromicrobium yanjiei]